MPVGGVKQAAQDVQARREAGQQGGSRFFKIDDGQEKVVRFLEQGDEIHWCWTHRMPPKGKQQWGDDVPCLDQNNDGTPCPGCEQGLPKKFKGFINMIERDAPKYAVDEEGKVDWNKVIGSEDALVVWEQGITVFQELDGMDADYRGLGSRDFKIKRTGVKLNTKYAIRPANPDGGPQELSEADKALAAKKADLKQRITPGTYQDMQNRISSGAVEASEGGGGNGNATGDVNPFMGAS